MDRSIVIAGFGGQGILFAGRILAEAALREGLEVLWIPSYGPEMRGGTASCTVILGDEPIGSPVVDRAAAVVALTPPSLARFEQLVVPGGLLVVNDSLIEADPGRTDVEILRIACSPLARAAGDDRLASVVALGALIGRLGLVSREAARAGVEAALGRALPAVLAADLAALEIGIRAADDTDLAAGRVPPAGGGVATATGSEPAAPGGSERATVRSVEPATTPGSEQVSGRSTG